MVDRSPVIMSDQEPDPQLGRPLIIGSTRPGAFKTNGPTQACTVHIDERYNTYHEVVAYSNVYGRSSTTFMLGKSILMLRKATDAANDQSRAPLRETT